MKIKKHFLFSLPSQEHHLTLFLSLAFPYRLKVSHNTLSFSFSLKGAMSVLKILCESNNNYKLKC